MESVKNEVNHHSEVMVEDSRVRCLSWAGHEMGCVQSSYKLIPNLGGLGFIQFVGLKAATEEL